MTDAQWQAWCDQPGTDAFGYPWSSWHRVSTCPCEACSRKRAHQRTAFYTPPAKPQGKARSRAPGTPVVIDFASPAVVSQMELFA